MNALGSNTFEIISVAVEKFQIESAGTRWSMHVHMSVNGPHIGLWLWAIYPASELSYSRGVSGYSNSRNEAVSEALNCIGTHGNMEHIDNITHDKLFHRENTVYTQYLTN